MGIVRLAIGYFKTLFQTHVTRPLLNNRKIPGNWTSPGKFIDYNIVENSTAVVFNYQRAVIKIKPIDSNIWQVIISNDKHNMEFCTGAVIYNNNVPIQVEKITHNKNDVFEITTKEDVPGLRAIVHKTSSIINFIAGDKELHFDKRPAGFHGKWVSCVKESLSREHYLGFGQKTGYLMKNNYRLKMWNSDNADIKKYSEPVYQSCPFQVALRPDGFAHGLYFDNSHYSYFKVGNKSYSPSTFYAAEEGPLCYYVLAGPSLKDVVTQFSTLTGRYKMPPLWVLGHHHSRWEANESENRVLNLSQKFREEKIPCDALHVDIEYMKDYRCFTFDRQKFPHPEEFMRTLHERNFKAVLISDPGIKKDEEWEVYNEGVLKNYFCKTPSGDVYIGPVWPGESAFVDYTNPDAARWWGQLFRVLTNFGVDGFWIDMNEPSVFTNLKTIPNAMVHKGGGMYPSMPHKSIHNIYGFLMAKASAEGIQALRPNERYFLFSRSSFAGIQRYASTWTGDNWSNWTHLQISIPMVLNMGLSGQVMTGPDIGGFWGAPTKELMARWIQVGSLYPFCRNHTSIVTPPQELWTLGDEVKRIAKKYLDLRYTLIPYLYTCLNQSCKDGIPMMRPLFFNFPHDKECYTAATANTEFMVGDCILAAPVLQKGKRSRKVYLPGTCNWYDWETSQLYKGGASYTINAPLDRMPVFVKAGSVIPMTEPVLNTTELAGKPIILKVFPDKILSGELYCDDGKTLDYSKGLFSLYKIKGTYNASSLTLDVALSSGLDKKGLWNWGKCRLQVHFDPQTTTIPKLKVNGRDYSDKLTINNGIGELPGFIEV